MNYEARIELYFELDKDIKEITFDEKKCCTNKQCNKNGITVRGDVKFCSSCGGEINVIKVENVPETPCCYSFGEKHFGNDFLFISWNYNDRFWFLNNIVKDAKKIRFDVTEDKELALSDIDFQAELEIYKADPFIKEILAKFDEIYGEEKVKMKIGLFPDYN